MTGNSIRQKNAWEVFKGNGRSSWPEFVSPAVEPPRWTQPEIKARANDNHPIRAHNNYLHDRSAHQNDAGLLFKHEPTHAVIEELGGAKGISVPDVLEPYQITLGLYYGVTTPRAASEIPHWHPVQTESYVIIAGLAEVFVKWRWDNGWHRRDLHRGDVILMQPEACHWFRWRSDKGHAAVFKAPQIPGVGKAPNGKTTCTNGCPHFQRGCVPPDGFNP